MIDTDKAKIEALLSRGVEEIFVRKHLIEQLESGKTLRIKMGIDSTGPKIHLGRAAALRKLKLFQDLGHQIVLIIGDFTARIGDASDKDNKRPMLTKEHIEENLKEYKIQIGKILDLEKWSGDTTVSGWGNLISMISQSLQIIFLHNRCFVEEISQIATKQEMKYHFENLCIRLCKDTILLQ